MTDFELMGAALEEARKAAALGEVPVGAVVAKDGEIISAAHNTRRDGEKRPPTTRNCWPSTRPAKAGRLRLWQCELFVTLEPAPCAAVPSSTAASSGWCTVPPTSRRAAAAR